MNDSIKTVKRRILFLQILLASVIICFVLWVKFSLVSLAQNPKESNKGDKEQLENDIAYTNKLLTETKKNKLISLNQLIILNNQIGQREELIDNIGSEIDGLDGKIKDNYELIDKLSSDLDEIKTEYARLIYYSFRSGNSFDRMLFLFSSEDFNQAYLRLKYLQQYTDYRKKQAEMIISTQQMISDRVTDLQHKKSGKTKLLRNKEDEKDRLTSEKNEKSNTISKLKQKEKELVKELKEKEKSAKKLKQAVEGIIAGEVKKTTEKSKQSGTTVTKTNITLTTEEVKISNTFESSKGSLPWPLEKGVIISTFGEHPHPVLSGIKIKNNGIDIATGQGANARGVYEGTVTGVMSVPGANKAVIVRHGDYLTVYSNLASVFVKKGEKIKTKQNLGAVFTNTDESKTELHFEIWYGKTLLNPADWLSKKK